MCKAMRKICSAPRPDLSFDFALNAYELRGFQLVYTLLRLKSKQKQTQTEKEQVILLFLSALSFPWLLRTLLAVREADMEEAATKSRVTGGGVLKVI